MPILDIVFRAQRAVQANREFRRELQATGKEAQTVERRLHNVGPAGERSFQSLRKGLLGISSLLGGVTLGAIFQQTVRIIGQFGDELAGVRAVTQATAAQMTQLNDEARRLGAITRFSAAEAASGMRFLGQAGYTTQQILAAIPDVLNLASAGGLGLARAADIASNVLSGFNLRAEDTLRVVDVLATTAASSNTNVEQLGEAMKFISPTAAGFKRSIEETAAAVGVLSNRGIQSSMAGEGLRRVLGTLADPTPELIRSFKVLDAIFSDVDLSLDKGLNPATNSLVEIFTRLKPVLADQRLAFRLFGIQGANAAAILANNVEELRRLEDANLKVKASAEGQARILEDTLLGDFRDLLSATQNLALAVGAGGLTAGLRELTQGLTSTARAAEPAAFSLGMLLHNIVSLRSLPGIGAALQLGDLVPPSAAPAPTLPAASENTLFGAGIPRRAAPPPKDQRLVEAERQLALLNDREGRRAAREAAAEAKRRAEEIRGLVEGLEGELLVLQKGSEALRRHTLTQTIDDAATRARALGLVDAIERQRIDNALREQSGQAIRRAVTELAQEINLTQQLVNIQQLESHAREVQTQLLTTESELLANGVAVTEDFRRGLEQLLHTRLSLNEALQHSATLREETAAVARSRTETFTGLAEEVNHLQALVDLQQRSRRERAIETRVLEARRRLVGIATGDEITGLRQLATAAEALEKQLQERHPLQEFAERGESLMIGLQDVAVQAFGGIEDAIVQFRHSGELNIKALVDSILDDLLRLAIRQGITQPLAGAINGGGGGFGALFSGLSGVISGLLGSGGGGGLAGSSGENLVPMQHGGITTRPTPVLLSEHGQPEAVIPLQALLGRRPRQSASLQITQTFVFPNSDAESFRRSEAQIRARTLAAAQLAAQHQRIGRA